MTERIRIYSNQFRQQTGWRFNVILCLLNFAAYHSIAQMVITSPLNNQVQQRDTAGSAKIAITAYASFPYSRITGQLIPVEGNLHQGIEWTFEEEQLKQGFLSISKKVDTGWYRLKLTGFGDSGIVDTASVFRVGIGEVFLVAGNSNAMGLPDLGSKSASANVVSFNAVNKFLNSDNITVAPDVPMQAPVFTPIADKNSIYPSGETSWYWGELGDMLFKKFKTPVLFLNAAWAAANSENYRDAASGKDALNIYVNKYWPNRQPFTNVVNTLRYFNSALGIRAVLWSHGENDAQLKVTEINYFNNIKTLIDKSRANSNLAVPWIIAKNTASQTQAQPYIPVVSAQNKLSGLIGYNTFNGPNLDTIQIPRPAHGHFENVSGGVQGLTLAATAWNRILSDSLFENVLPLQPKYAIHTGVTPSRLSAGVSFTVPYSITGEATETIPVHAELLDEQGVFIDTVGRGSVSPLQIKLPVSLANGNYKLRITGSAPTLPGSVSTTFYIDNVNRKIEYVNTINARQIHQDINVSWLMAANPGLNRMTLEKTVDGETYRDIQSFDAIDNEDLSQVYAFADLNTGEGTVFYRVRMESKNGETTYSKIAAVFRKDAPLPFIAFPNPVTNQFFYLRTDLFDTTSQCVLYDISGREHPISVSDMEVAGVLTIRPVHVLPSGKYILKIINGTQISTQSIVFY